MYTVLHRLYNQHRRQWHLTVRFLAARVGELLVLAGEKCREKVAALERAAGGETRA
jgi:hypothetical protein